MASMQVTTHIKAPPEIAFAVMSDFPSGAKLIDAITKVEMLTTGPIGKGTRFKETRMMFGREAVEEMTVTQFDPPRALTLEANSCGCHFASTATFAPRDGGTDMTMAINTRPLTLFARLMTPISMMMSGTMKKMIAKDMQQIKAEAEARTAEGETAVQQV